ncbi:MAG TPA: hypothetical protein VJ144_07190 [Candidatus Polarisedimenticolia bacterium]|nr:hypothetical protein [Candidatus Polarisedimenticolia bacterium]
MQEKVRSSGRSRPRRITRSFDSRRKGARIRIGAPRPALSARSMARKKAGLPSGNGLASRMPEIRIGIRRSAQKVAAFEKSAMFRPGM